MSRQHPHLRPLVILALLSALAGATVIAQPSARAASNDNTDNVRMDLRKDAPLAEQWRLTAGGVDGPKKAGSVDFNTILVILPGRAPDEKPIAARTAQPGGNRAGASLTAISPGKQASSDSKGIKGTPNQSEDNYRYDRRRLAAGFCWRLSELLAWDGTSQLSHLRAFRWLPREKAKKARTNSDAQASGVAAENRTASAPPGAPARSDLEDLLKGRPADDAFTKVWSRMAHDRFPRALHLEWGPPNFQEPARISFVFQYEYELYEPSHGQQNSDPKFDKTLLWKYRPDLILSATSTLTTDRLLKAAAKCPECVERQTAIISPTATATRLTAIESHGISIPKGHSFFYRLMLPDNRLAELLADELVYGMRPRQMAVFCEKGSPYADGLFNDLCSQLLNRGYKTVPIKIEYTQNVPALLWHDAKVEEKIRSATDPNSNAPADLRDGLSILRYQKVDAVGVFGQIRDKQALIPWILETQRSRFPFKSTTLFTTDMDDHFKLFDVPDLLVATVTNRSYEGNEERINSLQRFLNSADRDPDFYSTADRFSDSRDIALRPDIYLYQTALAFELVLRLAEQRLQGNATIPELLERHRAQASSDRRAVASSRAIPEIEFDQFGNLTDSIARPKLLLIQHSSTNTLGRLTYSPWWRNFSPDSQISPYLYLGVLGLLQISSRWVRRFLKWFNFRRARSRVGPVHPVAPSRADEPAPPDAGGGAGVREITRSARRAQMSGANSLASEAGFKPFTFERFFDETLAFSGVPSFWRYQIPWMLLFGALLAVTVREGKEGVAFWPNGHSILPTMLLRFSLAGVCLWWLAQWRLRISHAWALMRDWQIEGWEDLAKSISALQFHRVRRIMPWVLLIVTLVFVQESRLTSRPPISGDLTYYTYLAFSLFSNSALFLFFAMLARLRKVSRRFIQHYPYGVDKNFEIDLVESHFRQLIQPFINATITATIVLCIMILARGPWFDAWEWSTGMKGIYASLVLWVWYQQMQIHLDWRSRLRVEKEKWRTRLSIEAQQANGPESRKEALARLAHLEAASEWAWDARGVGRGLLAFAVPLIAFILQSTPVSNALELLIKFTK